MTTEDEARSLLATAAATIDVDETVPPALAEVGEPGHRRWPVLAAAAAVVVAVGGGVLVAQQVGGDEGRAPAVNGGLPSKPTDQPGGPVDDDRLPSLVGYTEDEAIQLLQERGHPVEVRVVPEGCNVPGIVTGTNPPAGTPADPGTPVMITVIGEEVVIDCVGEVPMSIVWDVVRAARGLAEPTSLDGADFPDDVRAAVLDLVNTRRVDGRGLQLAAGWAFDLGACFPASAGADGLRFWMTDFPAGKACPDSAVLVDFEGDTITSVRVENPAPDAVAPLTEARENAARHFIVWADGEMDVPPDFADRVRLVGGGFHPAFIDEPENRSLYSGCSGLGFPDCAIDPIAAVFHAPGRVEAMTGRISGRAGLPPRLAEADGDVVALGYREAGVWQPLVDLWIDDSGEIYAVAQTGMAPR